MANAFKISFVFTFCIKIRNLLYVCDIYLILESIYYYKYSLNNTGSSAVM